MAKSTKGKTPTTEKEKKFAAIAAPKNKITFADKIAGAKGKTSSKKYAAGGSVPKSIYDQLKEAKAENVASEKARQAKLKYTASDNTRVAKNFKVLGSGFKKLGGSCSTPKSLHKGK